jgi:hypothetical protein
MERWCCISSPAWPSPPSQAPPLVPLARMKKRSRTTQKETNPRRTISIFPRYTPHSRALPVHASSIILLWPIPRYRSRHWHYALLDPHPPPLTIQSPHHGLPSSLIKILDSYSLRGLTPILLPLNHYPRLKRYNLTYTADTWYTATHLADLVFHILTFNLTVLHATNDWEIL